MTTLLGIDGNSLLFRAFYAIPPLSAPDGRPTNAVYGFLGMLARLLREVMPTHTAVAFDLPQPTRRHLAFEGYKAGRAQAPEELIGQFALVKDVLRAMGIAVLEVPGFEADDILGDLARHTEEARGKAILVSGDRDVFQLVSDRVSVYYTKRGITDIDIMTPETVTEYLGVPPEKAPELKALMGDNSDNIPGVPGIGPKTAVKLLAQFGTLENVLANAANAPGKKVQAALAEYADQARLCLSLATIDRTIEAIDGADLAYNGLNGTKTDEFLAALGMKSLHKRLAPLFNGEDADSAPAQPAAQESMPVQTTDQAAALLAYAQAAGRLAVHWDEQGLTLFYPGQPVLACSFMRSLAEPGMDSAAVLAALAPVFENEAIQKVMYDAKACAHALAAQGIALNGEADDAMLLCYAADARQGADTLGEQCIALGLTADGERAHAGHLWALFTQTAQQAEQDGVYSVYTELEKPLWRVLFEMEQRGFKIDLKTLGAMSEQYSRQIAALESEIQALAGHPFNLNSPKQLGVVLFEELGLPVKRKTKSGYSTDAAVLEELRDEHPIVDLMLRYRALAKLKSTYLDGLRAVADRDGVVHTRFTQNVTATGRISSAAPNLQNIPVRSEDGREIRRAFVPSAPGRVLVAADYSQIELRVLAHIANEQRMIDVFRVDGDIHTATAARVYGVEQAQVTKQMRANAKAVNFGIIYGISDFGLARNLRISRTEAAQIIREYRQTYPQIDLYMTECVRRGKEKGYVETLLGRRRYLPDLNTNNFNRRSFAERAAMNAPIQGTAADLIKKAMIEVNRALAAEVPDAHLILQVHDELIVDCAQADAEKTAAILARCMEGAAAFSVPLKADAHWGENWIEAK
ncbi:MAG: DNA polymerase I [Clostridia bacterium]|nr:DNA polymerase I [Clostridia bacterium]